MELRIEGLGAGIVESGQDIGEDVLSHNWIEGKAPDDSVLRISKVLKIFFFKF